MSDKLEIRCSECGAMFDIDLHTFDTTCPHCSTKSALPNYLQSHYTLPITRDTLYQTFCNLWKLTDYNLDTVRFLMLFEGYYKTSSTEDANALLNSYVKLDFDSDDISDEFKQALEEFCARVKDTVPDTIQWGNILLAYAYMIRKSTSFYVPLSNIAELVSQFEDLLLEFTNAINVITTRVVYAICYMRDLFLTALGKSANTNSEWKGIRDDYFVLKCGKYQKLCLIYVILSFLGIILFSIAISLVNYVDSCFFLWMIGLIGVSIGVTIAPETVHEYRCWSSLFRYWKQVLK